MNAPAAPIDLRCAAERRVDMVGPVGRHYPVAAGGPLARTLNADFEDGARPWSGEVLVPIDRWLLQVGTWPEPVARRRAMRGGPWDDYEPHMDIESGLVGLAAPEPGRSLVEWLPPGLDCGAATEAHESFRWSTRAIGRIPEHIRSRLAGFRFGQWRLLRLASRDPAFLDLVDSNPALAWALASAGAFLEKAPRDIEGAALGRLRHRQRDIAGWLAFPATEAAVRLLRKVPPDSCGVVPLVELRKLAGEAESAERLRHLNELPATVILAAGSRILGPSLTPTALQQIVEEIARLRTGDGRVPHPPATPGSTVAHLLEDAARMAQLLPGASPPRTVHSLRALRRRHDELVVQFLRFAGPPSSERAFPAPPLPPGDGIEPIPKLGQLRDEARQQQNCVASYASRIASGGYYVYRVTRPERATLGLRSDRQGRWHIDQLAGPRNRKVSKELSAHVLTWFHASIAQRPGVGGGMAPPRRRRRGPHLDDPAHPLLPGM
ncbi:MAG TPA: hypothetical protein PLU30_07070 [Verrucomicrobiae bacterium]|nr:hypothetical protein [Verrucomicrobiae bacterium]